MAFFQVRDRFGDFGERIASVDLRANLAGLNQLRENLQILVEYLDGPFSHMQNKWSFQPDDGESGCTIEFFIDYAFRSRMLGALMGKMFDVAFRRFAEAFEQRANVVYGRSLGLAGA